MRDALEAQTKELQASAEAQKEMEDLHRWRTQMLESTRREADMARATAHTLRTRVQAQEEEMERLNSRMKELSEEKSPQRSVTADSPLRSPLRKEGNWTAQERSPRGQHMTRPPLLSPAVKTPPHKLPQTVAWTLSPPRSDPYRAWNPAPPAQKHQPPHTIATQTNHSLPERPTPVPTGDSAMPQGGVSPRYYVVPSTHPTPPQKALLHSGPFTAQAQEGT
ncbi:hypothetical protein SKAU_G00239390 [Synaphobranchus kaupii]|uniref:Uncharacterized protein n=1 Tax=Synaphobranchus kaupii TaxID=118154 RepID=A0A9Q1IS26_SYNKA|nr:hypothetical protein SKAU_G00239390 [Synaphobranchus kaupii]